MNPNLISQITGLVDLTKEPTRGLNQLDHIFSIDGTFENIKVVRSTVTSDHCAIVAYSGAKKHCTTKSKQKITYRPKTPALNARYLNYLSTSQCFPVPSNSNVQDMFDTFYSSAIKLLDDFFPLKSVTITSSDPSFVTPEIKSLLRRKNFLMRSGKVEKANAMAIKIGNLIAKANSKQLTRLDKDSSSQELWQMVKQCLGKKPEPKAPGGITADALNIHYASISSDPKYIPPPLKQTNTMADLKPLSEFQVFTMLDKLKPTATGLDGLPAWYLRLSAPVFCQPLTTLLNASLAQSIVPTQWKTSCIIPLSKVSKPTALSDFRPISITPVLSRLTERVIISTYVYPALSCPPPTLCFHDQFAFRPTGSTTGALITLYQKISQMLITCPFVRVIALDFSKAFDSIRHSTLIEKYADLDIPACIHDWLVSFFTGRQHCTKYVGVTSSLLNISASVIQGSAIGPASFSVTASDLRPVYSHNDMIKFADDTYLIIPSQFLGTTEEELASIELWSKNNNLMLNKAKSREILFYPPRSKAIFSALPPPLDDIVRVSTLKCLGVTLQSNFSFSEHISQVISSCATNLFAIRTLRSKGLNSYLTVTVFKSIVLSKLTYASQFWWGFVGTSERERLEAFLRKATRCNFYDGSRTFVEIAEAADIKLFNAIISNPQHIMFPLLPPMKEQSTTKLRVRAHHFTLPSKKSPMMDKIFIIRMLYKDSY